MNLGMDLQIQAKVRETSGGIAEQTHVYSRPNAAFGHILGRDLVAGGSSDRPLLAGSGRAIGCELFTLHSLAAGADRFIV